MEDGVDDLLLWGHDFEVILDIFEVDEAVEQQFVATANNVSLNCANLRFEFLATELLESIESIKPKHLTLNIHVLPAMTDQCFSRS